MTNDNRPGRPGRKTLAAMGLPLGLLAGVVLGLIVFDDIDLGIALGLGAGAVIAGTGVARGSRPDTDPQR